MAQLLMRLMKEPPCWVNKNTTDIISILWKFKQKSQHAPWMESTFYIIIMNNNNKYIIIIIIA